MLRILEACVDTPSCRNGRCSFGGRSDGLPPRDRPVRFGLLRHPLVDLKRALPLEGATTRDEKTSFAEDEKFEPCARANPEELDRSVRKADFLMHTDFQDRHETLLG